MKLRNILVGIAAVGSVAFGASVIHKTPEEIMQQRIKNGECVKPPNAHGVYCRS